MISIIAAALGLAFGSFSNVLIHRVGLSRGNLLEKSACTTCGAPIAGHDNIPVFSWLLLKGRCRSCNSTISWRYPVVELAVAALFVLFANYPAQLEDLPSPAEFSAAAMVTLALWWLSVVGIALAVIDFRTMRLPSSIIYPTYLGAVGLLGASSLILNNFEALYRALAGMAIWLVVFSFLVILVPKGMGLGDLKLSGLLGLFLGWFGWGALCVGFVAAFLFGAVFGLSQRRNFENKRQAVIAFGPWMMIGGLFGIIFGNAIWNAYISFLMQAIR